jgi:hypothetical protein
VAVGQRHAKHGARQDLFHRPDHFDWFFFRQAKTALLSVKKNWSVTPVTDRSF